MKRDSKPTRLFRTEFPAASAMLSRAFHADPFLVHFLPDPDRRRALAPKLFQYMLRYAALRGEIWTTSARLEGAAVWFPPRLPLGLAIDQARAGFPALPFTLGLRRFARLLSHCRYANRLRRRHTSQCHWYLQWLGVDPNHQGQGYATALLAPILARLDREHQTCCLDTVNGKNVAIYERFGFKVVTESTVPRTDLRLWLMMRGG